DVCSTDLGQEGLLAAPLLTHEQQRDHGAEQDQTEGGTHCTMVRQGNEALAQGTVADLVVILQEQDERGRWQVAAGFTTALAAAADFALVDETLAQAAGQDRKSTRLNSSHVKISYAVFCLKKKTDRL